MNSTVIIICFVVFCYNNVSGNETSAEYLAANGQPSESPCAIKIKDHSSVCIGLKPKPSDDISKKCCYLWVSHDCFKKFAQEKCTKQEYEKELLAAETHINSDDVKNKCKDYPYGSKLCSSGQTLFSITSLVFITFTLTYILQ